MYKRLLFIMISLIFSGIIFWSCSDDGGSTNPPPTSLVKIISPNGGDILQMGQTIWVHFDNELTEAVAIHVYKGQDSIDVVDPMITAADSIQWLIPAGYDEGFDYRLKIVSTEDPAKYDFSDAEFTIAPAGNYIMVTSPNGGGIWLKGSTTTINWITNIAGTVRIDLYKNGVAEQVIYNSQINDGSQGWTIPGTLDDGADYTIMVQSIETPAVDDYSDNFFCIATNDNSQNIVGDWTVAFSKQPDVFNFHADGTLTADSMGTSLGSGTWEMIGNGIKIYDSETSTYLIGIVDGDSMEGYMLTYDGYVVEWDALRVIPELLTPSGGQLWMRGTTQTITWDPAIAGNVVLSLADSTGVVQNIATVSGDLGTYDWAIPSNVEPGAAYLIRIHKEINAEAMDESDHYICISADETVDIVGEWMTNYTLTKGILAMEFNNDGTGSFANGTWTFDWELTGNGLSIVVRGYQNSWLSIVDGDLMDGTFYEITNTGVWDAHRILEVVTPNGGGFYQPADVVNITWYETITAENVTIDLYENDVFYRNIGTVNVNTAPSYIWNVPADLTTSTKYKIRMTSTTSDIYDESDAYFTVDAVPATPAIEDENFDDGVADNWTKVDGIWALADSIYTGAPDAYIVGTSSFSTSMTGNYVMEAKLRAATDVTSYFGGLVFNGDSSALTADGDWNNCVVFMINNGAYTLAVIENGVWNNLGEAVSTEINNVLGEWNILKVIVDNNANDYHIFINGTYIQTFNDPTFDHGYLGLHTALGTTEFDYVKISPVNKSAIDGIKINRVSTSVPGKSVYR